MCHHEIQLKNFLQVEEIAPALPQQSQRNQCHQIKSNQAAHQIAFALSRHQKDVLQMPPLPLSHRRGRDVVSRRLSVPAETNKHALVASALRRYHLLSALHNGLAGVYKHPHILKKELARKNSA